MSRIFAYFRLARFHKPIGVLLLLWPTLWGLWLAGEGHPQPYIVFVFVMGVILMRAAGCVINDWADRNVDAYVARTKDRPLARGEITPRAALIFFALLCAMAFALVLTLNRFTIGLAVGGAALMIFYPFTKRVTYFPQAVLGIVFGGWPVLMAYAALQNQLPQEAWGLFVIATLWPITYDTWYAHVDRDDDRRLGLKSTALWWGDKDRFFVLALQCTMLGLFFFLARWKNFGVGFYAGWITAAMFVGYQQYLVRDGVSQNYFRAFLNNAWLGAALFVGMVLSFI